jgi:hypothetical protein
VGANRRGPLAAFVVIAIIAAILLVTSVRSQASPGWLDPDQVPATAVATPPPPDPHQWGSLWVRVHHGPHGGDAARATNGHQSHGQHGAASSHTGAARVQRAWLLHLGWWTEGP